METQRVTVLNRVKDGEYGDFVQCSNCGRLLLVDIGEETCPECDENGSLMWADSQQEYSIHDNNLLLVDTE